MPEVILVGAGGHAKVVAEIITELNDVSILGFIDDKKFAQGIKMFFNLPILGDMQLVPSLIERKVRFLISIGDNEMREEIGEDLRTRNALFFTAVHSHAWVAPSARIGDGSVVMAGAVINADTTIGCHCIINTSSSIDHDCTIADYAHISPGVHLAGNVSVGRRSHVGIGSSVREMISIGDNVTVGAGSVVVDDLPSHALVYGVPAKVVQKNYKE